MITEQTLRDLATEVAQAQVAVSLHLCFNVAGLTAEQVGASKTEQLIAECKLERAKIQFDTAKYEWVRQLPAVEPRLDGIPRPEGYDAALASYGIFNGEQK